MIRLKPRRFTILPMLAAGGTVIFVFESMVPQPLPWAKLGLSNIAVLLAIYYFGLWEGLAVSWLKVTAGGLFTGGLFTPAFIFGIAGGGLAAAVMFFLQRYMGTKFSPVGVSIAGAAAHNAGQLAAAYIFFIRQASIWNLLPLMLLTSIFTGAIVGFVGMHVLERISLNAE